MWVFHASRLDTGARIQHYCKENNTKLIQYSCDCDWCCTLYSMRHSPNATGQVLEIRPAQHSTDQTDTTDCQVTILRWLEDQCCGTDK